MSRTFKDKKWNRKYPEWNYRYDDIVYRTYQYTQYYKWDSELGRIELAEPIVHTIPLYIQGKTKKPKKKRKTITEDYCMYSSAPSWWIRLTMNRPKRRKCRLWERKVIFEDVEEADCPDYGRKPFNYFY